VHIRRELVAADAFIGWVPDLTVRRDLGEFDFDQEPRLDPPAGASFPARHAGDVRAIVGADELEQLENPRTVLLANPVPTAPR